jgi:hypothetical protein
MNKANITSGISLRFLSVAGAIGLFLFLPSLRGGSPTMGALTPLAAPAKYIGSKKCENCHNSEASGDQHGIWSAAGHSRAFKVLQGEEAKKIADKQGIKDASKSDKCLKCHVTGYGLDKKLFKKSFDPEEGVGCESCHGPGDAHAKARFRAANEEEEEEGFGDEEAEPAYSQIPAGEILPGTAVDNCVKCHQKESPTFKPFCFFHREQNIRHINPLKPRTKAEKDALKGCDCEDEIKCEHVCTDKCGGNTKETK